MIPSTLLIVLFVQWTSSWIDFTLILPHTYDDGDGNDDDADDDDNDDDNDDPAAAHGGNLPYTALKRS